MRFSTAYLTIILMIAPRILLMQAPETTLSTYVESSTKDQIYVNNPLNIRNQGDVFKGERITSEPFKDFIDNQHGYRCGMKILRTYITRYGLGSIRKILYRYAPPEENPTENYIKYVSDKSGIPDNETIDFSRKYIFPIVEAMARFEQGAKFEPDIDEIEEAWEMI